LDGINPLLTLDNFLEYHNTLTSFIQINTLTNETFNDSLSPYFDIHFNGIERAVKIVNDKIISIEYMENNIIPLFNSADNSLIPKLNHNMLWLIEQFPLFSLTINNEFEDLKSFLDPQNYFSSLFELIYNSTNDSGLALETNFSIIDVKFSEIITQLNTQQSIFMQQFKPITEAITQINPSILSAFSSLLDDILRIHMFEKMNKDLNSSIFSL
jgi:hypothetical protein